MRRTAQLFVCTCALVACSRSPNPRPSPETTTRIELGSASAAVTPPAPGEIGYEALAHVTPHIRSLRVEPAQWDLAVGTRAKFQDLRVLAIDSAGRVLGRLPSFDRRLEPGAAFLEPDGVVAAHVGESQLRLQASLYTQRGGQGPTPEAWVKIVVHP